VVEYVVATEAMKDIACLMKILDLQEKNMNSTPLLHDNNSTIMLAKNPKLHDRAKHIKKSIT
jgi:hypothetical protein